MTGGNERPVGLQLTEARRCSSIPRPVCSVSAILPPKFASPDTTQRQRSLNASNSRAVAILCRHETSLLSRARIVRCGICESRFARHTLVVSATSLFCGFYIDFGGGRPTNTFHRHHSFQFGVFITPTGHGTPQL